MTGFRTSIVQLVREMRAGFPVVVRNGHTLRLQFGSDVVDIPVRMAPAGTDDYPRVWLSNPDGPQVDWLNWWQGDVRFPDEPSTDHAAAKAELERAMRTVVDDIRENP